MNGYPLVYAVKHRDESVRENSRSGGIFTAISDYILNHDGIVYGCVLDENFKAVHVRAMNAELRNLMRGSKYVQSEIGDTYVQVKQDLETGVHVMFSGTSCQIDGLLKYLGKKYYNLLCVDIVCHGVPSPKVWDKYLQWQEQRHRAKCVHVNFRNKVIYGWDAHVETITMQRPNGKIIVVNSEVFKTLFYRHECIRPACYKCPYKDIHHPADITIADYWGIDKAVPGFNDNKGVSLVLINTDQGKHIFDFCMKDTIAVPCKIEDSMQPPLIKPFDEPSDRKKFWDDFNKRKFAYIAKKYVDDSKWNQIKKWLRIIKSYFRK